jgi:hypothetical protein
MMIILLCGKVFSLLGIKVDSAISNDLWDGIYFSAVTWTTLGYGDITPVGQLSQILAIIEAFTGMISMSILVAGSIVLFELIGHDAEKDMRR